MIRSLRSLGKTILLTTHYLDEAQQLADRVAVIREGRIVSVGTPAELIGESARAEIRFRRNGEPVVDRDGRPDAGPARADRRGARRRDDARAASRCGGRRSRTCTSSSSTATEDGE